MSSVKDTVEKLGSLEAEKKNLLLEIEELKRIAEAKAAALESELATLRDEVKTLRTLMQTEEKQQQPPISKDPGEETQIYAKELAQKTVDASNKLENQAFALPPFSQYFDDWLLNLRQIVSDFESNSPVKVDEQFVKERSQILLDVEHALSEKKLEESSLSEDVKAYADNNQLLADNEKEYTEKRKELTVRKIAEVERITNKIHKLEEEVASQEAKKIKIFNYRSREEYNSGRKKAAEKLDQTREDLKSTRNELEVAQQSFSVEQEILDDNYEKKKREITEENEILHRELEKIEIDTSIAARQAACNALSNTVNSLIQRAPLTA